MVSGGHLGWLKITFDRISCYFRLIRNFWLFHKMAAGGHFGWPKITFDCISRHFRSIRNFYFFLVFSSQNDCRRPFLMAWARVGVQRWRRNQKYNTPQIFKFRGYNKIGEIILPWRNYTTLSSATCNLKTILTVYMAVPLNHRFQIWIPIVQKKPENSIKVYIKKFIESLYKKGHRAI